jgi:hypothetical protein
MSTPTQSVQRLLAIAVATLALAACGGGGGGSSTIPSGGATSSPTISPATPTPSPSPTPATHAVTGTLTDYVAKTAIAGATVTIGSLPSGSCVGWAGCGSPAAPTVTTTTASDGTFSFAAVANGTHFLTIALDAAPTTNQTYTILHRSITVNGATLALGNVNISQLSTDESAWLKQLNVDRATISYPATGPVVIDEYDQEAARAEAEAVAANTYPFGSATESVFVAQVSALPGAIGGYSGVAAGAVGTGQSLQADASFFSEKALCANGDWRTCPFSETTGHYINLSQDSLSWVGLGESATAAVTGSNVAGFNIYSGITTYQGLTARTASSVKRLVAPLVR